MKVLIIGGGLGGLTLAHGLLKSNIDVQVFERSATPDERPASYGIHLQSAGLIALHSALPPEAWDQLLSGTVPARDLVRFVDSELHTLGLRNKEFPENTADAVTRRRAVSRDVLRDALLVGLNRDNHSDDKTIHWGKRFSRYHIETDGRVTAHFSDGTFYSGDVLVGADGSNSRVRRQLLPGVDRVDLGIVNVAGRVVLTPELRQGLPAGITDSSVVNVVPQGRGWLFCSTWPMGPSGPHALGADSYLIWAWVAARAEYPEDPEHMTKPDLKRFVERRVTRWAPGIRAVIAATHADTLAPVVLRSMPRLGAWKPSQVTLLGDAIHNMTPMAGIGADTALRDAGTLSRALTEPGDGNLVRRFGRYEFNMRRYANEALALSTRNAQNAVGDKPIPRSAFRTMLRVGRIFPPLNRLMFGSSPKGAER